LYFIPEHKYWWGSLWIHFIKGNQITLNFKGTHIHLLVSFNSLNSSGLSSRWRK